MHSPWQHSDVAVQPKWPASMHCGRDRGREGGKTSGPCTSFGSASSRPEGTTAASYASARVQCTTHRTARLLQRQPNNLAPMPALAPRAHCPMLRVPPLSRNWQKCLSLPRMQSACRWHPHQRPWILREWHMPTPVLSGAPPAVVSRSAQNISWPYNRLRGRERHHKV